MNDAKPKTVFDERDQLRRENERLTIEIEALKSQRGISALLAADRTQRERELIEETHRLRAQLADANEIARQAVEQAKAATAGLEAARNGGVVWAIEYDRIKTDYDLADIYGRPTKEATEQLLTAHGAMRKVAREYRAALVAPAVERGLENNNQ